MNKNQECPRCGDEYTGFPALSRWDNKSDICGECGTVEALLQFEARNDDPKAVVHPTTGSIQWATPPTEKV